MDIKDAKPGVLVRFDVDGITQAYQGTTKLEAHKPWLTVHKNGRYVGEVLEIYANGNARVWFHGLPVSSGPPDYVRAEQVWECYKLIKIGDPPK